ncbi:hypothetical protein ACMFY2_03730 [Enterobacter cloacae subsp. cloacae]
MGWIDWKTIPDEGKSNTSHCIYTVKDPEDILAELNAGLSQQGDAVVTIAKKHKVTTEESGKDEQKRDVESSVLEPAAPVAGKPDGVPVVDVPVDVDVPANDDAMNASDRYTDEQLGTKLRRWRNWGLDEEAKAFCLSHGISSDEDSMNLFIQNYHVPAPASVEQQVNAPADELPLDHDDPIPF